MGVLRDMERDFSDPGVVQRFARDFSVSVPEKIDRLDRGIRAGDLAGAVDAISGVATSAVMVGATRLSQAALATQRLIAAEGLEAAGRSVALLRVCAADTVAELQGAYPTNP
jgi:HPt (histidine-containing phosphotransfer) domain-containing protein